MNQLVFKNSLAVTRGQYNIKKLLHVNIYILFWNNSVMMELLSEILLKLFKPRRRDRQWQVPTSFGRCTVLAVTECGHPLWAAGQVSRKVKSFPGHRRHRFRDHEALGEVVS